MFNRIAIGIGAALALVSGAVAAPCSNNNWQPTFVHDLDMEDGPYYVTADLNFLKLRWEQVGGFVPNACELLRGPQDLRNPRGFTTCQEYTRVQCGCSRNIPGNSTCAAFLRFHTAMTPIPGMPAAASPSQPPVAAAPPSTPPPVLAPPPGAPPTAVAPPPVPPSAAPIRPVSVPLSPGAWQQAPQFRAPVTGGPGGLVLQGAPWTNGRLQNGFYDGNRVHSAQAFDFRGGGNAYMRFSINGGGKYLGFYPRVLEGVSVHHLTTHHSWANSVVVPENTWLFAHLHVEPGGSYAVSVAQGNYGDRGGRIVYRNTGRLANPQGRLEFQFVDNYAGAASSVVIGEALVATGGGGIAPPLGATQSRGQPGGAACGAPTDCASSICLLGVCAPATH